MTHQELIEDFFSHSTERFWEIAMLDDKNYIVPHDKVCDYVRSLIKVPYDKFLEYLQLNPPEIPLESKDITQCSSFVACEREICTILLQHNNPGFSYDEIGRLLKQKNGSEKEDAYKKYGENQIKTAKQLGLAFEYFGDWYLSILGYVYMSLSPNEQHALLARTLLRDNLYAHIMTDIKCSDVELLSYMECISSESTKARRYGCVEFLVRICTEECDKEGVKIYRIAPRRKFQKKNAEWIVSHYSNFSPIAVPYNENLPINLLRRYHLSISNEGSHKDKFFALISSIPQLNAKDERDLLVKVYLGDKSALDAIVESYLPIIYRMARQYETLHPHVDVQDLIGEGVLGIYSAFNSYDPTRGARLLTYAINGIKKNMHECIAKFESTIHIPFAITQLEKKLSKIAKKYFEEHTVDSISVEKLSKLSGVPINKVSEAVDAHNIEVIPLDECSDIENLTSEWVSDKGLLNESLSTEITRALATLTPREAHIVRKINGIGFQEMTPEEIGDELHLTRERVRQIYNQTIHKLCNGQRSFILKTYLGEDFPSIGSLDVIEESTTTNKDDLILLNSDEDYLFEIQDLLKDLDRWSQQRNHTKLNDANKQRQWKRVNYIYAIISRKKSLVSADKLNSIKAMMLQLCDRFHIKHPNYS